MPWGQWGLLFIPCMSLCWGGPRIWHCLRKGPWKLLQPNFGLKQFPFSWALNTVLQMYAPGLMQDRTSNRGGQRKDNWEEEIWNVISQSYKLITTAYFMIYAQINVKLKKEVIIKWLSVILIHQSAQFSSFPRISLVEQRFKSFSLFVSFSAGYVVK